MYFFSSVIYYINIFFGQIFQKTGNIVIGSDINNVTYFIMVINMILILLFQFIPQVSFKKRVTFFNDTNDYFDGSLNLKSEKLAVITLALIMFMISFYIIKSYGIFSLESFDKLEILNSTGFVISYFKPISLVLFAYIFIQEDIDYSKKIYFIILFNIFITFMLGHRSYIVLGGIIILFDYIIKNSVEHYNMFDFMKKHSKVILLILVLGISVYAVKGVYVALFTGQFELAFERLTDVDYYLNSVKLAESNSIMRYINTVTEMNFRVGTSTYFTLVTYIIPLISRYIPVVSFSTILQEEVFVNARPGSLGSSFIAEAFSNGGIIMVIIVIFSIMILLSVLFNIYCRCKTNLIKIFTLICAIELSFYIHRNSLVTVLVRIRGYLYILILIYLIRYFYKMLIKSKI